MALSDLKRLSYEISGVLVDVEKGDGFNANSKKTLERVLKELQTMDEQTNGVTNNLERVDEGEFRMYVKFLRVHKDHWTDGCADTMEKLWGNIKKVDRKLKER